MSIIDIPEDGQERQLEFPYMDQKIIRRIQVRFGTIPGKVWKIVSYKMLGDIFSDNDTRLKSISILASLVNSDPVNLTKSKEDSRAIIIEKSRLVQEGCLWVNKSCLQLTYLDKRSKVQKVDFHHNERGQIKLIYVD